MPLNNILPIFPQVRIIDSVDILIDDINPSLTWVKISVTMSIANENLE